MDDLGRRPIIREAIIKVLKSVDHPIGFGQIRSGVAKLLIRELEQVAPTNIDSNLKLLVKNGQVEKITVKDDFAYTLSNSFYKTKNKTMIKSIIDSADLKDFIPLLEKNPPPLTAYFKNLESLIDPKRKKTVKHFSMGLSNWSNPLDLINRRMLDAFTDLEVDERKGIKNLLAHAYWYGVQSLIKDFGLGPLNEVLSNNRDFALKCIENAKERGDTERERRNL